MAEPAADALRLVAALEAGGLSEEQRRVAAALRQALTQPATTFPARDALFVKWRRRFHEHRSDHDATQEMAVDLRRYATTAWLRERSAETCPERNLGTARELMWAIMKISPRALSAERIRKIVGRRAMTNALRHGDLQHPLGGHRDRRRPD